MTLIALIDGDPPVYSCGFAAQSNIYSVEYIDPEGNGTELDVSFSSKKEANKFAAECNGEIVKTIEVEPLSHARQNVMTLIHKIMHATGAASHRVFLTGKGNFREELVDNYKANRDPTHKPYHYQALRDFMINELAAEVIEGQEADDELSLQYVEGETIICTIDKDLDGVSGLHYNWNHDKVYYIDELQARRFFYKQIITGDSTDNIYGLFKLLGKKATKKVLSPIDGMVDEETMWMYILDVFKDVPKETVITNCRLLHMRRYENEMWEPPVEKERLLQV